MDKITEYGESLKSEEAEQCYDEDNKKMPFTYPGCKKSPNQIKKPPSINEGGFFNLYYFFFQKRILL